MLRQWGGWSGNLPPTHSKWLLPWAMFKPAECSPLYDVLFLCCALSRKWGKWKRRSFIFSRLRKSWDEVGRKGNFTHASKKVQTVHLPVISQRSTGKLGEICGKNWNDNGTYNSYLAFRFFFKSMPFHHLMLQIQQMFLDNDNQQQ